MIFVGDATMALYEITHAGGSVEHWNEEAGAVDAAGDGYLRQGHLDRPTPVLGYSTSVALTKSSWTTRCPCDSRNRRGMNFLTSKHQTGAVSVPGIKAHGSTAQPDSLQRKSTAAWCGTVCAQGLIQSPRGVARGGSPRQAAEGRCVNRDKRWRPALSAAGHSTARPFRQSRIRALPISARVTEL